MTSVTGLKVDISVACKYQVYVTDIRGYHKIVNGWAQSLFDSLQQFATMKKRTLYNTLY